MASHLYRSRAMLQISRYVPALIARNQATQTTPSAGKGIPTPGNFNSAIPPTPPPTTGGGNTTGSRTTPPFGDPAVNQSFMNSPMGKVGAVAVLSIAIYAGYKMISGSKEAPKDKKDQKDGKDKKDAKDNKDPKANEQNKKGGDDKQADNAKK